MTDRSRCIEAAVALVAAVVLGLLIHALDSHEAPCYVYPDNDSQTTLTTSKEIIMLKPSKCPHCGVDMWREAVGVYKHPTPSECQLSGRAFRPTRKSPKDRRPSWEEYVAKVSGQEVAPPAPEQPAPPTMDEAPPAPVFDPAALGGPMIKK